MDTNCHFLIFSVILAPFGLAGLLTGYVNKPDPHFQRHLEEWRQFYPIDARFRDSPEEAGTMPSLVEVLVGGIKMRYPTSYVLVTDMDELPEITTLSLNNNISMPSLNTTGSKPLVSSSISSISGPTPNQPTYCISHGRIQIPIAANSSSSGGQHPHSMHRPLTSATLLPEHIWQDGALHAGQIDTCASSAIDSTNTETNQVTSQGTSGATPTCTSASVPSSLGHWDLADPTRKTICNCSKSVYILYKYYQIFFRFFEK